jgi:hypothetical protein
MFIAALLVVAVLRDWRFWPALVAWALILFAAILIPHGDRFANSGDTQLLWLLAGVLALVMGAREYINARATRVSHKAR